MQKRTTTPCEDSVAVPESVVANDRYQCALIVDRRQQTSSSFAPALCRHLQFQEVWTAHSFTSALMRLRSSPGIELAIVHLSALGPEWVGPLHCIRLEFKATVLAVVLDEPHADGRAIAAALGVDGFIAPNEPTDRSCDDLRRMLESRSARRMTNAGAIQDRVGKARSQIAVGPRDAVVSLEAITPRQNEVLGLLIEGKSNKSIARELNLAEGTVKVHVNAIYRTLGVHNRVGAIRAVTTLVPRTTASRPA